MAKKKDKQIYNKVDPFSKITDREKDPDEILEHIVEEEAKDDASILEPANPSAPANRRKYRIDTKYLSIMLLEFSLRPYGDKLVPQYQKISDMVGVPRDRLFRWYKKKDEIIKLADKANDKLAQHMSFQMNIEILRLLDALKHRDYTEVSDYDINKYIKTLVQTSRLLSNQSTDNVAHQHKHEGEVAMVVPNQNEETTDKLPGEEKDKNKDK